MVEEFILIHSFLIFLSAFKSKIYFTVLKFVNYG